MRRWLRAGMVLLFLSGPGLAGDEPQVEEAQKTAQETTQSREALQQALNSERLRAGELQLTVTRLRRQLSELARTRQEEQPRASEPLPQAGAGMKTGRVLLIALLALLLGVLLGLGLRIRPSAGSTEPDER